MKCVHDVETFSRYLEKDLSAENMQEVASHLENCELCRKELERLQTAMVIMKSVHEVPAPKNYAELMHEKLKQRKQ